MSTVSQNPEPTNTSRLVVEVNRDGLTKRLQLQIAQLDQNGTGSGYRIAGPKYNGSGETLLQRTLDERDAAEIRAYLDAVFPQETVGRAELDRVRAERDDVKSRLAAVLDICDREQRSAMRWENPLPVPEWVAVVQRAGLGDDKRKGGGE